MLKEIYTSPKATVTCEEFPAQLLESRGHKDTS